MGRVYAVLFVMAICAACWMWVETTFDVGKHLGYSYELFMLRWSMCLLLSYVVAMLITV